jgi:hypothetical protein
MGSWVKGPELHKVGERAAPASITCSPGELSEATAQPDTGAEFSGTRALCSALDEFIQRDTTVLVKAPSWMGVVERFANGAEAARSAPTC